VEDEPTFASLIELKSKSK